MNNAYLTGNKKMDRKIQKALDRDFPRGVKMSDAYEKNEIIKNPRIHVSDEKYRTYSDGTVFASLIEMNRWDYLLKAQLGGLIKDLRRQVEFQLQEEFVHRQWGEIKSLLYIADFTYINIALHRGFSNRLCVEDSKGGYLTDVYKIKRKLFLHRYGDILFFEV